MAMTHPKPHLRCLQANFCSGNSACLCDCCHGGKWLGTIRMYMCMYVICSPEPRDGSPTGLQVRFVYRSCRRITTHYIGLEHDGQTPYVARAALCKSSSLRTQVALRLHESSISVSGGLVLRRRTLTQSSTLDDNVHTLENRAVPPGLRPLSRA